MPWSSPTPVPTGSVLTGQVARRRIHHSYVSANASGLARWRGMDTPVTWTLYVGGATRSTGPTWCLPGGQRMGSGPTRSTVTRLRPRGRLLRLHKVDGQHRLTSGVFRGCGVGARPVAGQPNQRFSTLRPRCPAYGGATVGAVDEDLREATERLGLVGEVPALTLRAIRCGHLALTSPNNQGGKRPAATAPTRGRWEPSASGRFGSGRAHAT